ncbi:MAG: ECF-type sigma factor [Planctomycetota bacterium]
MKTADDITSILDRISTGEEQAIDELLPLIYEDLRKQAGMQMARERPDHTLQATVLVHDAYLRLLGQGASAEWESRGHFFAAAANAMRRILVDHARSKARLKRGGDRFQVDLTDVRDPRQSQTIGPVELLELDDALGKLEQSDPQVAELVRLRLYAGLSVTEAAKALGISRTVAYERWDYATSWFSLELCGSS